MKKGKSDKALRGRLTLGNLDAEYAKELEEAAARVKDASAAAKKRPEGGKVTQGELDRADGINILLLGQVIRAFDAAHDRDPTIPRLVPISTRRVFNRNVKKKGAGQGEKAAKDGKGADGKVVGENAADGKPPEKKPAGDGGAEGAPAKP